MLHELTRAFRSVRKGKGLTLAVVLVLGLGIGAATTFFSFLDAAFLRPLPYPDVDRLVALNEVRDRSYSYAEVTAGTLAALRAAEATPFSAVAGYRRARVRIEVGDVVAYVPGTLGTPGLLRVLGVEPVLGAFPDAEAPDGARLVLSDALWREAFGADPGAVGRAVRVNGEPARVAGVMPAGFGFPRSARLWMVSPTLLAGDGAEVVDAVARLAPGVSLDDARGALDRLAPLLAARAGADAEPRLQLREEVIERGRGGFQILAWFLFTAGILLLVLVTTNVASLLMVWHVRRRGEMAVRSALGAGRGRLLRQALGESLVLALLGGALGLVLARVGTDLLLRVLEGNFPSWLVLRVDGRVLLFTSAISLGSVLLFGLLPSLRATRMPLGRVLRGAGRGLTPGRGEHCLRARFVGAQVAVSTLLVAVTILFVATAERLGAVDPGHPAGEILALTFDLPDRIRSSPGPLTERMERYRTEFSRLDGVEAVSYAGGIGGLRSGPTVGDEDAPLDARPFIDGRTVRRAMGSRNSTASTRVVGPDYLRAMGLDLVEGRGFGSGDTPSQPLVAVVPRSVAERLWPGESAIGKLLTLGETGPAVRVVGVIADRRQVLSGRAGIRVTNVHDVYLPASQALVRDPRVLVRAEGAPMVLLPAIQARLVDIDPAQAISRAATLEERFHLTTSLSWDFGRVFLFLAGAGLLICVVGLFGLVAQLVVERRHEIGIRLALGAEPGAVVHVMARRGFRTTMLGALVGLLLSLAATPLVGLFVYDAHIWDPLNLLAVVATVLGVGWTASFVPARRAAGVEPAEVLAAE